ncbi:NAD(P)-dependent alcohol dehydrogenase [Microbacterium dauci]|uniref:NAD(P)-dependent alcohol dehydrogenase n=1 Tax=Microbacterium dauci TaxID=3048008 RepID=A0ABT6ZAE8_9MICO|nr:NAD(P)-dependent alcohol dehydrogenase [Microbacterium sp. LX3-4]MDJ1113137.1 NAD(P)-dependent alcohol dehydrogenase [Microbacterium sp. LX3-4]
MTTMTVWRQRTYGSAAVVRPETVPLPIPGRGEVLVHVDAASLNAGDIHLMRGEPLLVRPFAGFGRPRVAGRGMDLAGTVTALGQDAEGFALGDRVVGAWRETLAGAVAVPTKRLTRIPDGVSTVTASTLPVAGNTAVDALDTARVRNGSRVLVVGAGGGVGTMTVQLAAARGAEVWATCGARAVDLVRALGAAHAFDYRVTDLATLPPASFDAIIDIAGEPPLDVLSGLLAPRGTVAFVGGDGGPVFGPLARATRSMFARGRFRQVTSLVRTSTTAKLLEDVASGVLTPHVSQTFPFAEAGAALAAVESGRTVGKVCVVWG